jgi:hypothetical protein
MDDWTGSWRGARVRGHTTGLNWAQRLYAETPPGMSRLNGWHADRCRPVAEVDALDADPHNFIARVADVLDEAGAAGAIYVEVRFGAGTILRPELRAALP